MARRTRRRGARSRLGIALAGGGPLGGIYEIGALAALADCLEGIDFNRLDVLVGVSSGAFIAAGLANGITPRDMSTMFIESDRAAEPFDPALLLRPAYREIAGRVAAFPGIALGALGRYVSGRDASLLASLQRLARVLPTGVFGGGGIDRTLARLFEREGRTNDFRKLARRLLIVATDLDSGAVVEFGAPGREHVPISTAVQASAALPGLFPPVAIDGKHYSDGALQKTMHASVALEHGADLVVCINPLVPFDAAGNDHRVVDGGLPAVLSQTFRTILQSRMQKGMALYANEYPDRDLVLFQPERYDADLFFTNMFSYSSRRRLAEHAYQRTREELLRRRHKLAPVLARHGIGLREGALADPQLHLVASDALRRRRVDGRRVARRLSDSLDELDQALAAYRPA